MPNGRDMWALLAVTPSVMMGRIDVGGNRAGTQTGYSAYGQTGQVRVLIEGINTTEGTGGAGFYFDYASLEEAFLGTTRPVGGDAEPRRAEPVHRALGQQPVSGRVSPRLVQQRAAGVEHPGRIHGADRVQQQPDSRAQQRDRSLLRPRHQRRRADREGQGVDLRHLPRAVQRRGAAELPVRPDLRHEALESGRQGDLSAQSEEQADRLLPVGPEGAAEPAAVRHLHLRVAGTDVQAGLGQLGLQGRVERHDQRQAVSSRRATATSATTSRSTPTAPTTSSGTTPGAWSRKARTRSSSSIATASSTPAPRRTSSTRPPAATRSSWAAEFLQEQSWEGFESRRGGTSNIEQIYNNGVSTQVIFGIPTASCQVGSLAAHDCLESIAALDQVGASSPTPGRSAGPRSTLGVRYDRYHAWLPEQEQLAGTVGPVVGAGARRSPRPTSTRGTRSRRASAWSTTWPATAGPC